MTPSLDGQWLGVRRPAWQGGLLEFFLLASVCSRGPSGTTRTDLSLGGGAPFSDSGRAGSEGGGVAAEAARLIMLGHLCSSAVAQASARCSSARPTPSPPLPPTAGASRQWQRQPFSR